MPTKHFTRDEVAEKRLRNAQQMQTAGDQARELRNQIMIDLYHEHGYTQRALAELISEAAVEAGGEPLTEAAVNKVLSRHG